MAKRIFTAFAVEDKNLRDLLVGQRLHGDTPFEWIDMSVKEPWDERWRTQCRSRIKGCDGLIGIITTHTPKADGQLWELKCAAEERKPTLLIHGNSSGRLVNMPPEIKGMAVIPWTWDAIASFVKRA